VPEYELKPDEPTRATAPSAERATEYPATFPERPAISESVLPGNLSHRDVNEFHLYTLAVPELEEYPHDPTRATVPSAESTTDVPAF
jgi:hypothetical protein